MDKQRLTEILLEMRSASMQVSMNLTEENIKKLMTKYDMLFLGQNVNSINSIELEIVSKSLSVAKSSQLTITFNA